MKKPQFWANHYSNYFKLLYTNRVKSLENLSCHCCLYHWEENSERIPVLQYSLWSVPLRKKLQEKIYKGCISSCLPGVNMQYILSLINPSPNPMLQVKTHFFFTLHWKRWSREKKYISCVTCDRLEEMM